jgi:nucleoside-diphosphate-sugar epimerase
MEAVVTRPLPATVLVTGANGFLGRHVCEALVARRIAVRGLVRQAGTCLPAGTVAATARGLDDLAAIRAALQGVDGVIHLAARVHQHATPDATPAFRAVNVAGTRTLLGEAISAGVRDFVFFSSVKAVGEGSETPWTESTPPAPADAYGATKLEAEAVVRSLADREGVHAPILRLPLVYGPEMKANALRLFQLVDRGVPLPLGSVRNRRSLLFTGNLMVALFASLESPAGSDTFFVSDAEDLSTPALVALIARSLGRQARLVPFPVGLLRMAGRAGDVVARARPFPITTAAIDRLVGSLAIDSSKLTRLTGYSPPYSVAQGLRITAEWYLDRIRPGH